MHRFENLSVDSVSSEVPIREDAGPIQEERRQAKNSQFRKHIDILFDLIRARDEIWSVGILCRFFYPKEFRRRIAAHGRAAIKLRRSIVELQKSLETETPLSCPKDSLITPSERNVLLGRPQAK